MPSMMLKKPTTRSRTAAKKISLPPWRAPRCPAALDVLVVADVMLASHAGIAATFGGLPGGSEPDSFAAVRACHHLVEVISVGENRMAAISCATTAGGVPGLLWKPPAR